MAILLNKWIFPIRQSGEASRWRVCYQRGLPCLVLVKNTHQQAANLMFGLILPVAKVPWLFNLEGWSTENWRCIFFYLLIVITQIK